MRYEQFSYRNINSESSIFNEDVQFMSVIDKRTDYIHFGYIGDEKTNPHLKLKAGWKFHISIDDTEPENIERAWNALAPLFVDYRLSDIKILKSGMKASEVSEQRGKQITIYAFMNVGKEWPVILTAITRVLTENGIRPSYRPPSDRAVKGSNYLSYRNDATDETGKHASLDKSSYNPAGLADPFEAIEVKVPGQLEIPVWMEGSAEGARAAAGAGGAGR